MRRASERAGYQTQSGQQCSRRMLQRMRLAHELCVVKRLTAMQLSAGAYVDQSTGASVRACILGLRASKSVIRVSSN